MSLDFDHGPIRVYDFRDFWREHAEWSQSTFGRDSERGPTGPLKHLAKEVQEALSDPTDITEYADLVLLAFDAARRAGLTHNGLLTACRNKLAVNKARQWPKASGDEPVEHVRGEEEQPS